MPKLKQGVKCVRFQVAIHQSGLALWQRLLLHKELATQTEPRVFCERTGILWAPPSFEVEMHKGQATEREQVGRWHL